MIKRMYAVYDVKTMCYGMPFFCLTDGEALRVIMDAVSKPGTTLADHPNDYRMDYLGELDICTGAIKPVTPVHLAEVAQLVQK